MKKRWTLFFIKLAIAIVAMAILVRTVNFREIDSAFQNPQNPVFILLAVFLLFPNVFLQLYRWHYLLRLLRQDISLMESISSFFGGMVVGFVTPGRIGEVGRSLFLKNVNRLQSVGLVFIDKLYSFLTILVGGIWGLFSLLVYHFNYGAFIFWPLFTVAFLVTLSGLIIVINPQVIRTFLYNLSLLLPYRDKIKQIISCIDSFQKKQAIFFLILSFLLYFVYILQFCLLAFAFQKLPWTTVVTATTSTIFAKTLFPVSLADLGIREGASVYFFLKFHVEKVTAFNSALLLFAINVLIPTLIGLFFLPKLNWGKDS